MVDASHSGMAPKEKGSAGSSREPLGRGPVVDRRWPLNPSRRLTSDSFQASLGNEAQLRLGLQRRARHNFRRLLERGMVRLAVLVAADLGSFVLMRGILRAVRDYAILGPAFAHDVGLLMPRGALTGWQFPIALILCLLVTGSYGQGDRRRDVGRLFVAAGLAVAVPLNWNGLGRVLEYALTTALIWAGLVAERLTVDQVVGVVRPAERNAARAIFVGLAEKCRRAAQAAAFNTGPDYRAVGFADTRWPPAADALGAVGDLPRLIHQTGAEAVVICGYFRDSDFEEVVDTALWAGCELISVPRTLDIAGLRPTFVWRDGEPLVRLAAPTFKAQQLLVKRIVDLVGAFLGLVLCSPLLLLLGALIELDSRGPVFFRQQRVGFGGRIFGVVKFRTMVDGADAAKESIAHLNQTGDPRLFKIPDDPRVTKLGRFLRRSSLDEIPQFWNVLVGEMSLVGPRPFFPVDLKEYKAHHLDRLGAKPGITGLWQVSGRSSITDFEEVVRLDREYIDRWSLWLDLKILVRTIPAVLRRNGAY